MSDDNYLFRMHIAQMNVDLGNWSQELADRFIANTDLTRGELNRANKDVLEMIRERNRQEENKRRFNR